VLPTEADHVRRQRRLSWWLLVARLTSGRTQADAANALGIVGSSYGDFERGVTTPSLRQMTTLAALFEVDLALFVDPPETDEDRIERMESRGGRPSIRTDLRAEREIEATG
jgi:transcriptional regulator with XRE-family HTH domain